MFGITKAGVKMTRNAVNESKQGQIQAEAAIRKAFVQMDITYSCQESECTIQEDYDNYVELSKKIYNIFRIISAVIALTIIIAYIISSTKIEVILTGVVILECYRFGQSIAQPLVRLFQNGNTIVRKSHNASAIKLAIPILAIFIGLFSSIEGGSLKIFILALVLMIICGIIGFYRQHFNYIYKSYSMDSKKLFEDNEMLRNMNYSNVYEVRINNNELYINNTKQQVLRWSNLTDFGALSLAKCYYELLCQLGYNVDNKVIKEYINGNDLSKSRNKNKPLLAKKAEEVSRHAGVDTDISGYVLSEILIKKVETNENRMISKQ